MFSSSSSTSEVNFGAASQELEAARVRIAEMEREVDEKVPSSSSAEMATCSSTSSGVKRKATGMFACIYFFHVVAFLCPLNSVV
jgi:hypothetical protein